MAGDQVSQLMHLGALAFAVSAGYVGLDRIRHDPDPFRADLDATCDTVKKDVVTLDLENAEWSTQKIYLIHPVFVLVMVASSEDGCLLCSIMQQAHLDSSYSGALDD